jgi:hypothetical protein
MTIRPSGSLPSGFAVLRGRLTFANLTALLALFVALGGSSYAALALPKASVGAKQLKKNSVTSPKVKPGSLRLSDFRRSQRASLRGPQGLQGPKGDTGAPGAPGANGAPGPAGSAVAFAHVTAAGGVDATESKNVAAANVTHPVTGVYCFQNLSFTPRNAVASPSFLNPRMRTAAVLLGRVANCPPGTQVSITMVMPGGDGAPDDTNSDSDFMIAFN